MPSAPRADPPVSQPGQPYPHPFRERGKGGHHPEERFEIEGSTTRVIRWTYGGGWTRSDFRTKTQRHPSPEAARAALDAMVKRREDEQWAPLPAWPETPTPWVVARPAGPPPARLPPRSLPLPLGKLRVVGGAAPVKASELDAFANAMKVEAPDGWASFLRRFGPGVVCGRLTVRSPADAVRATKRWRKTWKDEHGRTLFRNYEQTVGARAGQAITIGHSVEGDEVLFLADTPSPLYVLPRHYDMVVVARDLPAVLGHYLTIAREVDGLRGATFQAATSRTSRTSRTKT